MNVRKMNLSEVRISQRPFGLRVGDDDANAGKDLNDKQTNKPVVLVMCSLGAKSLIQTAAESLNNFPEVKRSSSLIKWTRPQLSAEENRNLMPPEAFKETQ